MTTRTVSLIEQKRLQWNKEREEMTKFYGLWTPSIYQINQRKISDGCITHLNKLHEVYEIDDSSLVRCLPPIQRNAFTETNKINDSRNYSECNTSGYGSETDTKEQFMVDKKKQWKSQSNLHSDTASTNSMHEYIDDNSVRMKWGDRGVGVGHLWEPTLNSEARLPEINNRPGTPHWLQRSLLNKNHCRGQNLPNEPDTMLIREQKKLKALELQEAIKQQLQEREKKRKEDKEHQLEEERKLDQRVKKQQELEKSRIEDELKKQKEKEEKETIKSKIMQEAIANAAQMAKEAKTKNRKQYNPDNEMLNRNNNENLKKECQNDFENNNDKNENIQVLQTNIENDSYKKNNEIRKNDAFTSLTTENYYEDFQTAIPLITNKWTQTNTCLIPNTRKKIFKINCERPKWGVNRPSTKYMKQSEKDIFYQKKVKHRYRRDRFEQEPSGSSRSFDSTDESKSLSTSPNEKDFEQSNLRLNLNLRKEFSKCYIDDKSEPDESTNCREYESNVAENPKKETERNNSTADEEILNQLQILSNNLSTKQAYWKEEMKKMTPEFLTNSHHTP